MKSNNDGYHRKYADAAVMQFLNSLIQFSSRGSDKEEIYDDLMQIYENFLLILCKAVCCGNCLLSSRHVLLTLLTWSTTYLPLCLLGVCLGGSLGPSLYTLL